MWLLFWPIGIVIGWSIMPILKGYHIEKYGSEWTFLDSYNPSKFKHIGDTDIYFVSVVLWPVLLPYKLYSVFGKRFGSNIAKKELTKAKQLKELTIKFNEHQKLLAAANKEVEELLRERL